MEGLDEELKIQTQQEPVEEAEKETGILEFKKKPFAYWTTGGTEHKLKLTTGMITKLETKYRSNIMNLLLTDDGIPPLSVMLTTVQAAINPWEHGISYSVVEKMFDQYLEEGGDQQSFYKDVILPLMMVSGFFTKEQRRELDQKIEEAEMLS